MVKTAGWTHGERPPGGRFSLYDLRPRTRIGTWPRGGRLHRSRLARLSLFNGMVKVSSKSTEVFIAHRELHSHIHGGCGCRRYCGRRLDTRCLVDQHSRGLHQPARQGVALRVAAQHLRRTHAAASFLLSHARAHVRALPSADVRLWQKIVLKKSSSSPAVFLSS